MNRGRAAFDRLITFVLFLLFAGLAFWAIGQHYNLGAAERIGDYADQGFWAGLTSRDNYTTILVVAAVVLGLVGLLLIGVNIERRRLGRRVSPTSATTGTIRVTPADIASAVAQSLERRDGVTSTSYRATRDRGTQIIQIRLRVPAEADVTLVHAACLEAAGDIAAALPGQDVRPRFLLQTEQPSRRG
ncbi:MAG: hypothetical protein ACTH1D_07200 [Mycobacteriaceae bacterium]|uniref:hypothetical protein n=1 Tax=Corynebacterium sp. TaxID=1720 RepID=UPI003F9B658F